MGNTFNFTGTELFPRPEQIANSGFAAARCAAVVCNFSEVTRETFGHYVNQLYLVCRDAWQPILADNQHLAELYHEVFVSLYAPWLSAPTPVVAYESLFKAILADDFSPKSRAWLCATLYFHELTFWGSDVGTSTEAWLRWPDFWHCVDPEVVQDAATLNSMKQTAVFEYPHPNLKDWLDAINHETEQSKSNSTETIIVLPKSPADLVCQMELPDSELELEGRIAELDRHIELLDMSIKARKESFVWLDSHCRSNSLPNEVLLRERVAILSDPESELPPILLAYLPWPDSMVVWAELLGQQRAVSKLCDGGEGLDQIHTLRAIGREAEYFRCHFRDMMVLCEKTRDRAFQHLGVVRLRSPPAWRTVKDLADKHGLPREALRKRLERWQHSHRDRAGEAFIENQDRRKREKWLYREDAVREVITAHKQAQDKVT